MFDQNKRHIRRAQLLVVNLFALRPDNEGLHTTTGFFSKPRNQWIRKGTSSEAHWSLFHRYPWSVRPMHETETSFFENLALYHTKGPLAMLIGFCPEKNPLGGAWG